MTDKTEVLGLKGLDDTLKTISWHLIRDTNTAMGTHASDVAGRAKAKAARIGGLARMVAGGLASKRSSHGDGGSVTVGGSARLPTGSGTYGDVFFGAEWGGGSRPETRQFRPWKPDGYWFYPAVVEANESRLGEEITKLQTKALKYWAG